MIIQLRELLVLMWITGIFGFALGYVIGNIHGRIEEQQRLKK